MYAGCQYTKPSRAGTMHVNLIHLDSRNFSTSCTVFGNPLLGCRGSQQLQHRLGEDLGLQCLGVTLSAMSHLQCFWQAPGTYVPYKELGMGRNELTTTRSPMTILNTGLLYFVLMVACMGKGKLPNPKP